MTHPDEKHVLDQLNEQGYVILENVLPQSVVEQLKQTVDEQMHSERDQPYAPGNHPAATGDDDLLETFLAESYSVSDDELERLVRRIRHTRSVNHDTPWPIEPKLVNKCFMHLPTLFDHDRSQRVWNLLTKGPDFASLVEHPEVLGIVRQVLGQDCILSDVSATSIGAGTQGGAWHVDVPLGQLPEPLPDFPLTTQNAWILDDFTPDNGATRIVPGSHLSRKKPKWSEGEMDGEVILCAPAGSVAIWLSNTWHRSGPNVTDQPRRAILCYYCRSWVQPFTDYTQDMSTQQAADLSPTTRYLAGFGARGLRRG